jgi:CheY-like chemotaxis protein
MPGTRRRRALVVEADPAVLQVARVVLEGAGFAVDAVDSGIAALVAARDGRPDLIIMDQQLRDVSGREAIGWLRSNPALQETPIILLTAGTADEAVVALAQPGAALRKPASRAALQRTIQPFC